MKIITDTKLKTELKKLKTEIQNEFPKEIKCSVYAVHYLYINEDKETVKKERENLNRRGFKLHETIKPRPLMLHFGCLEKEIWIKEISESSKI